jgi:hypothetical protein
MLIASSFFFRLFSQTLRDYWRTVYKGADIDEIFIVSGQRLLACSLSVHPPSLQLTRHSSCFLSLQMAPSSVRVATTTTAW